MTFFNPAILGGIGLIAIPIIIHILQKNRVKEMEWAAMKFLLEIVEEQNKKIQLEDLLLLLLRVLMFLFLALAISRPLINFNAAGVLDSNGEVVILLDDTYSMNSLRGTETRFDVSRKRLNKLLEHIPEGYQVNIVKMNEFPSTLTGGFSSDLELLKESIKKMKAGYLSGNVDLSFDFAVKQFSGKEGSKTLYVVSDFQKKDWENVNQEFYEKLKKTREKMEIFFIPIDDDVKENLAIESINTNVAAVKLGQKTGLVASIRNFGPELAKDVQVDILLNGDLIDSKVVSVPGGQSNKILFHVTPDTFGDQRVEVRIRQDLVMQDNSRFYTLHVIENMKVLGVLNSAPIRNEFHELMMTELALNPYQLRSKDENALYKFDFIGISDLTSTDLNEYDIVFLANIRDITSIDAKPLEDYIRNGGGVFMFLGEKVNPETYNSNLYKEGKGIWKNKLVGKSLKQPVEDRILEFQGQSKEHPIWEFILSEGRNYLAAFRLFESHGFEPGIAEDAVVLASVKIDQDNNEYPVLMDFKYGQGHMLVYGSTGDMKWGLFQVHASYPAFIHQCVKYLRSFSTAESNLPVYAEFTKRVSFEESQNDFVLESPKGEVYTVSALEENENYFVKLKSNMLSEHGFFTLKHQGNDSYREYLSVNLNIKEGEVEVTSKGVLEGQMKPFEVVVDLTGEEMSTVLGGVKPVIELALLFLILAFLCWVAENYLGYRITKRA